MKTLEELKRALQAAQEDAFYSECLEPETEAQIAHNQSLVDGIRKAEEALDNFNKKGN